MYNKMLAYIRTRYTNISARGATLYQRALTAIGIEDCPEMRITAAVAVSIALFYICVAVQYLVNLLTDATQTLTALLLVQ